MGYSQEIFKRVRADFDRRSDEVYREADRRREEVRNAIPGIAELDARLSGFGLRIMDATMRGGDTASAIAALRAENLQIQEERAALLRKHGFPADYDKPHFQCDRCRDTGYVGTQMCSCMRRELTEAEMEASGLSALMRTQSFENFSLNYYRSKPEDYERMTRTLDEIKEFAAVFGSENDLPRNLLFIGATGLGKTHLSTALARKVIERGYDVFYNSAVGMLSDFEARRFGNGMMPGDGDNTARYTDCDLLIIDDLGTEVVNQFTLSCLYYVINTRLNLNKQTVISTNLSSAELRKTYSDRITSRLFGEFYVLPFSGTDVRRQKIK